MSEIIGKISGPGGSAGIGRVSLPITTGRPMPAQVPAADKTGQTFRELLERSLRGAHELTFSRHAQVRAEQRGVSLSDQDMRRLSQAVEQAEQRGITDSLVFMNDTAFIVNVPNRVVVTVVEGSDTEHNVFTNINGAVIA